MKSNPGKPGCRNCHGVGTIYDNEQRCRVACIECSPGLCPSCDGAGYVECGDDYGPSITGRCVRCKGKGKL